MILNGFIDQNNQKINKKRAIFSDRKNTVGKIQLHLRILNIYFLL